MPAPLALAIPAIGAAIGGGIGIASHIGNVKRKKKEADRATYAAQGWEDPGDVADIEARGRARTEAARVVGGRGAAAAGAGQTGLAYQTQAQQGREGEKSRIKELSERLRVKAGDKAVLRQEARAARDAHSEAKFRMWQDVGKKTQAAAKWAGGKEAHALGQAVRTTRAEAVQAAADAARADAAAREATRPVAATWGGGAPPSYAQHVARTTASLPPTLSGSYSQMYSGR